MRHYPSFGGSNGCQAEPDSTHLGLDLGPKRDLFLYPILGFGLAAKFSRAGRCRINARLRSRRGMEPRAPASAATGVCDLFARNRLLGRGMSDESRIGLS